MIQIVLVIFIFAAACFYLGRYIYQTLTATSCHGCGSCKLPDFSKMEADAMKKQGGTQS